MTQMRDTTRLLNERIRELEEERDEWKQEADRRGWPKEAAQEFHRNKARVRELEEALSEDRLWRVFWKHTVDANLNTDEGCRQAAKVVVAYVAALVPDTAPECTCREPHFLNLCPACSAVLAPPDTAEER